MSDTKLPTPDPSSTNPGAISHRVLKSEAGLVSSKLVNVYQTWKRDFVPDENTGPIEVDRLVQFGEVLPFMAVLEDVEGGDDYLIKFQGAELAIRFQHANGLMLSDSPDFFSDAVIRILDLVQSSRTAVVNGPAEAAYPGREFMQSQGLFLPVQFKGDRVHQTLVYDEFIDDLGKP